MDIVAIVLLALLILFFMMFAFLALCEDEPKRHKAFPASSGPGMHVSQALAIKKLREKYLRDRALQHLPAAYHEAFPGSASGRIETFFSPDFINERDIKMNTHINMKKQDGMTVQTEIIELDGEKLAGYGFTCDEIVSLLQLQKWYQSGGSDRVELVRHWEFLRLLVLNGKLEV